jgi:hypothetical protein
MSRGVRSDSALSPLKILIVRGFRCSRSDKNIWVHTYPFFLFFSGSYGSTRFCHLCAVKTLPRMKFQRRQAPSPLRTPVTPYRARMGAARAGPQGVFDGSFSAIRYCIIRISTCPE